jgi:DNA-binding MurR/RpiR family transcriptional regulator
MGKTPESRADSPAGLSVAEKIRQRLGELSPSERRVARTLLAGPPTIGLESAARLAQSAGVSGPTVSRFIAELGFSSYGAFQRELHEEISARMMPPDEVYRRHREKQRSPDLLGTCARVLGDAVANSVAGLDPAEFRQAVSLVADAGRPALVTGGWFSQLLAGYLASVLRELRPEVRLVGASASDRAGAIADLRRRDTLVAFDFRRYDRDTLAVAQAAHAAGARIVLVTDPWLSPVADVADAVLTAQVSGPSPFESLTAALAVVETLVTSVADELGDAGRARFERFGEIAGWWVRPWPDGASTADGHAEAEPAAAHATVPAQARAAGSRAAGSRAAGSRAAGSRAAGSRSAGSRAAGSRATGKGRG